MRIAVVNWTPRLVGGAETYLAGMVPALARRGHSVVLVHEHDGSEERGLIGGEHGERIGGDGGPEELEARVRAWKPDVVWTHIVRDPDVEAAMQRVAPAVFFAHGYYGACISGLKTHQSIPRPCSRPLGPACLLHYYPHRCGGLSPVTMWRDYRVQRRRQDLLAGYHAIVTGSAHMRAEFLRQGVPEAMLHTPPFYAPAVEAAAERGVLPTTRPRGDDVVRLLFTGRMDALKGGELLLAALQTIQEELACIVDVTFAGDGPERSRWEAQAALLARATPKLRIRFVGWQSGEALETLWREADLLVVPSVWPEPFGLVGPEAGIFGLPVAAFDVGGIRDWLTEGENGHLASGDRPHPHTLALAVVACLKEATHHAALRAGAARLARRFRLASHLRPIEAILARASEARLGAPRAPRASRSQRPGAAPSI